MTDDLPVLDLACLKVPGGRCVLVVELCVSCRNREVVLVHAAAYENYRKSEELHKDRAYYEAVAARNAVLKLAGLTAKDLGERG